MPQGPQLGEQPHQLGHCLALGLPVFFSLQGLPVLWGVAPALFGLGFILFDVAVIEGVKIQNTLSFFLHFTGKGEHFPRALVLQFQQGDLLFQGLGPVEARAVQDRLDLLEGELQLAEQQDGLQAAQGRVVIQPVARLGHRGGL